MGHGSGTQLWAEKSLSVSVCQQKMPSLDDSFDSFDFLFSRASFPFDFLFSCPSFVLFSPFLFTIRALFVVRSPQSLDRNRVTAQVPFGPVFRVACLLACLLVIRVRSRYLHGHYLRPLRPPDGHARGRAAGSPHAGHTESTAAVRAGVEEQSTPDPCRARRRFVVSAAVGFSGVACRIGRFDSVVIPW